MTLSELLIDLAGFVGNVVADATTGEPALPDDAFAVAKLKSCAVKAVSQMRLDYAEWYCLRRNISFSVTSDGSGPDNVDGDPTRFRLPWFVVGTFATSWAWTQSTTRKGKMVPSSLTSIEQRNADGDTGAPERCSIVPGTEAGTWELRIAPAPDGDYTIRSSVLEFAQPPTQLHQRSPFGAVHDQTLLAAMKWMHIKDDAVDPRRDTVRGEYLGLLSSSRNFDLKTGAPATVGRIVDPGCNDNSDPTYTSDGEGLISYNGILTNP